jgi:hypothetical protein
MGKLSVLAMARAVAGQRIKSDIGSVRALNVFANPKNGTVPMARMATYGDS